jgi:hypothetical protein
LHFGGYCEGFFAEILYVFTLSRRTQAAITPGLIFFVGFNLLGEFYASRLHFSGTLARLEQAVILKLMKQYEIAVFIVLISSWTLAFKLYHRDKKRFF